MQMMAGELSGSTFYLWGHVLPLWMRYPWWIQSKNKVHTVGDPNRRKRSVFSPWSSISSQYTCLIIKWDKTDRFPYSTNLTELPFSTSAALGHFPSTRVGPTSLGKVPEESPTGLCGSLYYSFSSGSEGWQSVWSHLFYFSCQKVYQLVWIIEIGFFLGRCGDDFIEYNPNIKISDYLLTEVFWILNSFPRPQKKRIQQSHPPPQRFKAITTGMFSTWSWLWRLKLLVFHKHRLWCSRAEQWKGRGPGVFITVGGALSGWAKPSSLYRDLGHTAYPVGWLHHEFCRLHLGINSGVM